MGEQALTLLTLASEDTRSRAELLAGIGLSDAYGDYRRHLVPLIEGGYLARTIPEKPNSQYQRSVLPRLGAPCSSKLAAMNEARSQCRA